MKWINSTEYIKKGKVSTQLPRALYKYTPPLIEVTSRSRTSSTHTHTQTLSSFPELLFLYLICVLLNMVIIMKGLSCTWFNLFLCLFSALLLSPSGVCECVLVYERDTACVLMSVSECVCVCVCVCVWERDSSPCSDTLRYSGTFVIGK